MTPKAHCNTHAGEPSRTSNSTLDVTGVMGVSCSHSIIQPNGVVDLAKGERFSSDPLSPLELL